MKQFGTCVLFRTHSISEVRFFRETNYDAKIRFLKIPENPRDVSRYIPASFTIILSRVHVAGGSKGRRKTFFNVILNDISVFWLHNSKL